MNNAKHFFVVAAVSLLTLSPLVAGASTLSLSPARVSVREGESFSIAVGVNAGTAKQYTVKMDAIFTPNVISLSTWRFNDDWTVLRQSGYDALDNKTGKLVRTGGYPSGFTGPVSFGVATFRALTAGQATIDLGTGTFVYDELSSNTFAGANTVVVDVLPATVAPSPAPVTTTPAPVVVKAPDHTFDIALVTPKSNFDLGESITAVVHITNLSPKIESIQVPVHYLLIDTQGAIVQENQDMVALEGLSTKFNYELKIPNLPAGAYTLVARIEDPTMTAPAESKAAINMGSTPQSNQFFSILPFIIIAALLVGILLGILMWALFSHSKSKTSHKGRK